MTKAPTPPEISNKQRSNIKNATKYFDYTTIANWLRTVSWSNISRPTGVVKPVCERSTFPLTATAVSSKGHTNESKTLKKVASEKIEYTMKIKQGSIT